ncbi:ABC-2 type transport system ATP-binding protein [Micromonospora sediminimaris]|uniref:Multidrug ABC transporter ATP-binding protein n=2 Tax=Micromonospora sediminimaris TaxID=547162 RepID=A0A9W5UVP1_9ACTN|nr:multidrug ABC transporter ATP-binding protein [Micromonospora sediminimaris]SFD74643.1 ABC-2 type transport system ATP-binding protein [Micromonospora sediminimaris]
MVPEYHGRAESVDCGTTDLTLGAPSVAGMIQIREVTKRYGTKTVVDRLSFTAKPGQVTGFLGPNGAGKSTTMRMVVGLDAPSAGDVLVNGKPYASSKAPLREIGVLLEAKAAHPGRTAVSHLLALARTHGIPRSRVDEVLGLAGLSAVAHKRVGAFSLGMGQRLGIAAALLGDPAVVMLDEPVNGLDPEGVLWVRKLLTGLAAEGRTVMLSSHLMSEVSLIADHLVIVGRGGLLADTTVAELVTAEGVRVVTPAPDALRTTIAGPGVTVTSTGAEELLVAGASARVIGLAAASRGIPLFELTPQNASLEAAFMDLTRDAVEYEASR